MHDALFATLVEFIGRHGGVAFAERLAEEHHRTVDGKCACCKAGKYTYMPWPCTSHKAAERAIAQAPARRPVLARVG